MAIGEHKFIFFIKDDKPILQRLNRPGEMVLSGQGFFTCFLLRRHIPNDAMKPPRALRLDFGNRQINRKRAAIFLQSDQFPPVIKGTNGLWAQMVFNITLNRRTVFISRKNGNGFIKKGLRLMSKHIKHRMIDAANSPFIIKRDHPISNGLQNRPLLRLKFLDALLQMRPLIGKILTSNRATGGGVFKIYMYIIFRHRVLALISC